MIVKQHSSQGSERGDHHNPTSSHKVSFTYASKQNNSKSRSFAAPDKARQQIKLFSNSFGKGSKEENKSKSFLSMGQPRGAAATAMLSARSNPASANLIHGPGDCLSSVSESLDQSSFVSMPNERKNEVTLELIK